MNTTNITARLCMIICALLSVLTAKPDTCDIDSIDILYVKNSDLALKRLALLRDRCMRDGWKECSRPHLEAVEALAYQFRNNHYKARQHAYEALRHAGTDIGDRRWKLTAMQVLCNTFAESRNWVLLGKYARLMRHEAEGGDVWYVGPVRTVCGHGRRIHGQYGIGHGAARQCGGHGDGSPIYA